MPPKIKKNKFDGKELAPLTQNSGLLDAYMDASGPSEPTTDADKRPVTKKNKNMKKREAEKLRQLSESEAAAAEKPKKLEVIESWEDLEANSDETQLPRTIEFPFPKVEESVPKQKKQVKTNPANEDNMILEMLAKLEVTVGGIEKTFSKMSQQSHETVAEPAVENPKKSPQKKEVQEQPQKVQKDSKNPSSEKQEKTAEEIKDEREAKKAAKAAKVAASKNKNQDEKIKQPAQQQEGKIESKTVSKPDAEGKSNAEQKAERRAKQDEQRAKKAAEAAKKVEKTAKPLSVKRVPDEIQADRASVEKKLAKRLASQHIPPRTQAQRKVMLFSHLHQYEREFSLSRPYPVVGAHIHPAVVTLGLQYSEGTVTGSNSRCVALLKAMKSVIEDYSTPANTELSRDLNDKLKLNITFLKECRPLSVSMGNAIRFLKARINGIKSGTSDKEAKQVLVEDLDEYVHHNIVLAAEQIAITACDKIREGDVILTYGCSSLLTQVFKKAVSEGRKFRVVVADGRPRFEGQEMARRLVNIGVHCTYVLVSAVPYIIHEVTKVFLGAHAVLANGCVMSRVGTSEVALVAKSVNVPVLICCETYKFSERVQTDSFVYNELGDPDDLVATGRETNHLEDWRDLSALTLLNLTYDVTPASLVDAIISEISVIPCTSVPVVLRLKNMEHAN